jgi:hypothetical protein
MKQHLFLLAIAALTQWTASAQTPVADGGTAATYTVVAQGSTPSHRSYEDTAYGQVYIYVGGSFPAGTYPAWFQFLFDFAGPDGNTTGYITPLLFERVPGEIYTYYVIAGIGQSFQVSGISPLPQTIPFKILEGVKITPNANYTFGFVNAMVDANGVQTASSAGVIDHDYPADSGAGVGGATTTNDWMVTFVNFEPKVGLGATFGLSGSEASYDFYEAFRTYSALAYGLVSSQ